MKFVIILPLIFGLVTSRKHKKNAHQLRAGPSGSQPAPSKSKIGMPCSKITLNIGNPKDCQFMCEFSGCSYASSKESSWFGLSPEKCTCKDPTQETATDASAEKTS
jgi:hypothetical protein